MMLQNKKVMLTLTIILFISTGWTFYADKRTRINNAPVYGWSLQGDVFLNEDIFTLECDTVFFRDKDNKAELSGNVKYSGYGFEILSEKGVYFKKDAVFIFTSGKIYLNLSGTVIDFQKLSYDFSLINIKNGTVFINGIINGENIPSIKTDKKRLNKKF